MTINVSDFLDVSKNALVQWEKARKEFPSVRSMLADVKNVSDRTSEYSSTSNVETARRRNDGDDSYIGSVKQGYTKNFTQAEIALQVNVTKQMRMFDKYDEIMQKVRMSSKAAERRIELDLASLLFNAWGTTYTNIDGETVTTTTPDGLALIDNAHTVNGTADTWSNEIDTTHDPISTSVLERLEEKFNGFLDDGDGRVLPVMADTIITSSHAPTVHEVRRINLSQQEAGSANNDVNTFKGVYKHIIVPFLNMTPSTEQRDSNRDQYVFLAQLGDKDVNGFKMEFSQMPKFESPEQVYESGIWQFQTNALYDFGTLRPSFIAGTKGDGTAV